MTEKAEEKLPISEFYKVIEYVTVFKSQKWWKAIVIFESQGKRALGVYLWVNRNGVWKRKQKLNITGLDEWNKLKDYIDQLIPKLVSK
jgi:hypothetical protein